MAQRGDAAGSPGAADAGEGDARSVTQVLRDIADDLRSLLREEVALAKAEFNSALRKLIAGAVLLVIGAVLASTGLNALVASAVLGLATTWAPWLAALVVGLVIAVAGAVSALAGLASIRSAEFIPERTIETLKDDVASVRGKEGGTR